jgi:hypothetical protein
MCMLCVIPPNVIPSREKLENSALNNPHGFGFAIVVPSENRIHSERTMNADTSINRFLEMRAKYPEGYAMWHARLATHGSTTVDNCHPFKVGHDEQTYLAHNGILPIVEPQGDLRSDTRIFAEDLLPAIGGVSALDNDQVFNLMEDFTSGSKVCILTVDPSAKHQCYLIHENKGKVDASGVWWSNDSCYLPTYTNSWRTVSPTNLGLFEDEEFWAECRDPTAKDFCPTCGSCWMCNIYKTDCLCYQGSNSTKTGNWWNSDVTGGWGW